MSENSSTIMYSTCLNSDSTRLSLFGKLSRAFFSRLDPTGRDLEQKAYIHRTSSLRGQPASLHGLYPFTKSQRFVSKFFSIVYLKADLNIWTSVQFTWL